MLNSYQILLTNKMTELTELKSLGVAPRWPDKESLIKHLRAHALYSMDHAEIYNSRQDSKNKVNATSSSSYLIRGSRRQSDAIATALENGDAWRAELGESMADLMFAHRLQYFWHCQFDILFPDHSRPLALMDWESMANSMAFSFFLGWTEQAIYQGYLTFAALNCRYQLRSSCDERRSAHAFMLKLFADWRGDGLFYDWPTWGSDAPVYSGILERWRTPNLDELTPWLLAACDRHTHESLFEADQESQREFADFRLARTPVEILLVFRLRAILGLESPNLEHSLMAPPFEGLPEVQPTIASDALMQGTLKRAREDWPQFDQVTSLDALMMKPSKKDRFRR